MSRTKSFSGSLVRTHNKYERALASEVAKFKASKYRDFRTIRYRQEKGIYTLEELQEIARYMPPDEFKTFKRLSVRQVVEAP